MQRDSTGYTLGFALVVCAVASVAVSSAAVSLKPMQEANKVLDRQTKILVVAGLMEDGAKKTPEEVQALFDGNIVPKVIDMKTFQEVDDVDVATFDQRKLAKDPATSFEIPENAAKVARMPEQAMLYEVNGSDGKLDQLIVPVQGPGLWSTLYGFVSVDSDANTIRGITFYEHGETPGLGGEVDNAKWKAGWVGRKIADDSGTVQIRVKKGKAGDVASDPFQVDGLSGATLTANGVTKTMQFWLGDAGFGPYLKQMGE